MTTLFNLPDRWDPPPQKSTDDWAAVLTNRWEIGEILTDNQDYNAFIQTLSLANLLCRVKKWATQVSILCNDNDSWTSIVFGVSLFSHVPV